MRVADETTRRRILDALRSSPATPSGLADRFDATPGVALNHVEHLSRTLEGTDERLLVRPPTCRECGFDDFDDRLNLPSRCPECKAESVREPAFVVEDV